MPGDLLERIRKLAVLMADEAAKAFPGDHDAQIAMVRGASQIAPRFVTERTQEVDFSSRPRW